MDLLIKSLTSDMQQYGQPEIGTAWLVLSHGVFFAAQISASSLGSSFLKKDINQSMFRPVGIFWLIASLVIGGWTFYAIDSTMKAAKRIPSKLLIFDTGGFVFLFIVNGIIMVATLWTLVLIGIGGLT